MVIYFCGYRWGVPDAARCVYQSAFQGHRVCICSGVGLTALSRAAQDPVLRLHERSPAAYTTSDAALLAQGTQTMLSIMVTAFAISPLSCRSWALAALLRVLVLPGASSGPSPSIGISRRYSLVSCALMALVLPVGTFGLGVLRVSLPRVAEDKVEYLLEKRGSVLDRHSLAAADLLGTFAAARCRLSMKHCTWDECVAFCQWIVRGVAFSWHPLACQSA